MTQVEIDRFKSGLIQRKNIIDKLGIRLMTDVDYDIAERMSALIPCVKGKFSATGSRISINDALDGSICYLKYFGPSYVADATSKLRKAKICAYANTPIFCFSTHVQYTLNGDTGIVDKSSGRIDHFKTPAFFDNVSSMWLAHEHIHSLKETNYFEYVELAFSDVIPMFFELLIADKANEAEEDALIRNRLFLLYNEIQSTKQVKQLLSSNDIDNELYQVHATSSLEYLNGFYYAIQLYDMYKQSKEDILLKVCEVLKGHKTTKMILEELGILYTFDEEKAKQGVKKITQRIK